jgi:hypothetical protein
MGVIAVARWQARPGQEAALVATARTLARVLHDGSRPEQWIFQQMGNPATVLYVDEWNSHAEYQMRDRSNQSQLDVLCDVPVERSYFRALHHFERASDQVPVFGALLCHAPPSAIAATRAYLDDRLRPLVEEQPACIRRTTYQDLDDPGCVLTITGWRSVGERRPAVDLLMTRIDTVLRPLGARIERFDGRTA